MSFARWLGGRDGQRQDLHRRRQLDHSREPDRGPARERAGRGGRHRRRREVGGGLAARPQPRVRPRHRRHLPEERLGARRAEGDGRDAERAERIVLSNHATPEIRVKCQQLGATKVFDKSNELDEMLGWLNRFAQSDRGAAASRPGRRRGRCRPRRRSRPSPGSGARRPRPAPGCRVGLPAALAAAKTCAIAACTLAWFGVAEWPSAAARSDGPMNTPSTPSTAAISAAAARPLRLSICTITVICSLMRGSSRRRCRSGCCAARPRRRGCPAAGSASRRRRGARLLGALDERHQEVVEAGVEQALDLDRVVPRRPHDRRADAVLQRHQLRDEGRHVVRRVLAVEQQPVEAGDAEHLGRDRVGERAPAADQRLAGDAGAAERVREGAVRIGRSSRSSSGRVAAISRS